MLNGSSKERKRNNMKTVKNFDIHALIDEAMKKKDRSINLYFTDEGISVNVIPVDRDYKSTEPVQEAYRILVDVINDAHNTKGSLSATVIEALGYLGEFLDD